MIEENLKQIIGRGPDSLGRWLWGEKFKNIERVSNDERNSFLNKYCVNIYNMIKNIFARLCWSCLWYVAAVLQSYFEIVTGIL